MSAAETAAEPSLRRRRSPRILLVCEGNICRSPAAELLLESLLDGVPVRIASAGLGAALDRPMPEPMRAAIADWGVDAHALDEHRGRQLTPELLERSDLVLTMTREQRTAVVRLAPALLSRAFTLAELARLADGARPGDSTDPGTRLRQLLASVQARRPLAQAAAAAEDIADPYRRSHDSYEQAAAAIRDALERAAPALRAALTPGDGDPASAVAAPVAPPPGTPPTPARRS
ncbi:low molecular weight phosphatase family protein [Rathayibacter sp. VKM Ac-2927]|uniref:arsenate reductase/protein-tyrosine-phosphatase family protein n=1 Tax=Rathayibacter sp. VKM Ac-2927 TaxID=2929478 RepID=UPI0024363E89|nr:low molecular weight phosphatase family protein [Rathayibacter sp. VKM Ac-2927]